MQGGPTAGIVGFFDGILSGGSWGEDDAIVYATSVPSGLWQVPAVGGEPVPLTELGDDEVNHM